MSKHGEAPAPGFPTEDDPALANVWADMDTWLKSHPPCECESVCECEDA